MALASNLLAQLELRKKVVTGDALYCQRELSLRVLEQGGDYLWALKDNQPRVSPNPPNGVDRTLERDVIGMGKGLTRRMSGGWRQ